MLRIDENTYIDDTLVSCVEYQLFIDEMREQGKHYQPDHWTSYQFPKGQAHAPIVGVRFSDAKAFCEWLTRREAGEWSYRVPPFVKAEQYPLPNPVQSLLGYWASGQDGEAKFSWVGPISVTPRALITNDLAHEIDHAIADARPLDLTITRTRNMAIDSKRDNILTLARARNRYENINHTLDLALDRDRIVQFFINRDSDLARAMELTIDLDRALETDRALALDLAPHIHLDRANIRDLYNDIFTLQERIAGRSPAFEGIRIVKERKP
jgi:hypothetical protein